MTFHLLHCLVLIASFLTFVSGNQLQNPCKINQFRCSDGSKCLLTEQLCNGKKDCPRGEDERGSVQWDCTKTLLSTQPCHPTAEFKCRFGGCIDRDKICDGVADCWGATDESVETCVKSSKPNSNNKQVPSAPRPTSSKPIPTKPSQPRPSTTTAPSATGGGGGGGGKVGVSCPPIIENPLNGFTLECENRHGKPIGDCSSSPAPIGAVAKYSCAKYHQVAGVGGSTTKITCKDNGEWTRRRASFHCSLECGIGGQDTAALITGGVASKRGKWPWHTALFHEDPPNSGKWDLKCGGSLITPYAILTAAHCATKKFKESPLGNSEIQIALGKYHRSYNKQESGVQMRRVRHIEVNPNYNHDTLENDIAILFIDKPAVINDFVRPVCVPDEEKGAQVYPEVPGNLVGWGRSTGGKFKDDLQEAIIPVVDSSTCKNAHATFSRLVRSSTFCAGYRNGTSACDGDSGGGLVFEDSDTKRNYNLQGIVSAGVAKSTGQGGCEDKYYAVFTRVAKFHAWIEDKLDRHGQRK